MNISNVTIKIFTREPNAGKKYSPTPGINSLIKEFASSLLRAEIAILIMLNQPAINAAVIKVNKIIATRRFISFQPTSFKTEE